MKKTIIFILLLCTSNLNAQNSLIGTWHILNTSRQYSQYGQPDSTFSIEFLDLGVGHLYGLEFCNSLEIKSCSDLSNPSIYPSGAPGQLPFTIESISNGLNSLSCGNTEVNKASQVCLKMFGGNEPQNSNLTVWVTNFNSIDETCTLTCIRDEINGVNGTEYSINLAKNFTAGIKENDFNQVSIYPNPTSKDVTLEITDELLGKDYFLKDNTGRIILSGQFKALKETMNLEQIANGVYFIKIDNNANLMYKIVKN